jgi:hypothetical protein
MTGEMQDVKFYQTGTFTVGNRLLGENERTVQANMQRTNSLNSGHRACQGCGEALGPAMRSTPRCAPPTTSSSPSTPRAAWKCSQRPIRELVADPVDPFAVRQRRGGRLGVAAACVTGRTATRRRPGRRRRHHRHRLRLPVRHVRAQRRRSLHLLRQRGVHEHRRAALQRHAPTARTATTPAVGKNPATCSVPARTCR